MSEITYYQKNRDIMLNAKEYYKNNKDLLREQAKNKYRSLSKDEKDIKKQYQKARYNMRDEEKQRLKDYQKNYREARKLKIINNNT